MGVTVRLFARYAELFGAEHVDVTLCSPATVADLVAALRKLPGGSALPGAPFVAVNMTRAQPDTALAGSDEIALLPPLSGG